MTQYWEPGTQYNSDDVVEYEGSRYKIIQPHRSQGDWTPPVTPALWGRLNDGGGCCQKKSEGCHSQQPQQCQQSSGGDEYSNNQGQAPEESRGEKIKDWAHDHKKELEIGAGIAGAAGLAAGAFAYKKHHDNQGNDNQGDAPEESRVEKVKDWAHDHKKGLEIGAGIAGVAALAGGAYAYKKHHDNEGNAYDNQGDAPEESRVEKVKDWAHDHKKELEIGAGIAGVAALAGGAYAYKKHHDNQGSSYDNQGDAPEESRGEKVKDWAQGHKKELEIGGGLLAGAAALAGGTYAYKKHEEHKKEHRNDDQEY